MSTIMSAATTGLPSPSHAISPRRSFQAGLATLPLIGGSVALLGRPSAVAEPVTDELMWTYKNWLYYEHKMLSYELAGHHLERSKTVQCMFHGSPDWHFDLPGTRGPANWDDAPQPSSRAALVLSAVGCDWHTDERRVARRRA